MLQNTFSESIMPPMTIDDSELREGDSISVYPITQQRWDALAAVASARGETRSDIFRNAIGQLLDDRDAGKPITYTAAPRLHAAEKMQTKPRIVWIKSPLLERFRDRCKNDRVAVSEFILEALKRYLKAENIDIDPAI
jgi:hypothetical protein